MRIVRESAPIPDPGSPSQQPATEASAKSSTEQVPAEHAAQLEEIEEFALVVVGAGPAGMEAARIATRFGRSVCLIDDNPGPGGQIWRSPSSDELPSDGADLWDAIDTRRFDYRAGSIVFAADPSAHTLQVWDGSRTIVIRYRSLLLACGARERFLPFPGWTDPRVVGVGGLQALSKGGFPVSGQRIVVAGTGPLLLAVADSLRSQGAEIVEILEQTTSPRWFRFGFHVLRQLSKWPALWQFRRNLRGVKQSRNTWPTGVDSGPNGLRVKISDAGHNRTIDCDLLAVGFGLAPNLELARHLGCAIEKEGVAVDSEQRTSIKDVFAAGELTGIGGIELAVAEARIAAQVVCEQPVQNNERRAASRGQEFARALARDFALRPELRNLAQPSTVVCRCEDVPYSSLAEHNSWRSAKLHTRCGMGPCQGRVCGQATEFLFEWATGSIRPPISPVPTAAWPSPNEVILRPKDRRE